VNDGLEAAVEFNLRGDLEGLSDSCDGHAPCDADANVLACQWKRKKKSSTPRLLWAGMDYEGEGSVLLMVVLEREQGEKLKFTKFTFGCKRDPPFNTHYVDRNMVDCLTLPHHQTEITGPK
jgi:hypothetical protein